MRNANRNLIKMCFFRQNRHFSQKIIGINIKVIHLRPYFASAMSYERTNYTIVISNKRIEKGPERDKPD